MLRDNQRLDSYQNLICSPAENESIEAIGGGRDSVEHISHEPGYMEVANIYAEGDPRWDSDEDAERIASDLSAGAGEDDRRRTPRPADGSGERDASGQAHQEEAPSGKDAEQRGRAVSGEPFEDEADNALFRRDQP
jgi:hypothetical protein